MTTAVATFATNNLWAFCIAHLGDAEDDTKRAFLDWNADWFNFNLCFWLPVGRPFYISPPVLDSGGVLTVGGERIVFGVRHPHYLVLPNAILPE